MTEKQLQIRLKTLTPLWTGGIDGQMDRIHETGLIGSLRWWYETIIRGLGGKVCDPTKNPCALSGESSRKFEESLRKGQNWRQALNAAGFCEVCKIFGATGWRRRFRLTIAGAAQPVWDKQLDVLNIRPPDRNRGWYLPRGAVNEDEENPIVLSFRADRQTISLLAALFLFLERWGNLGAKPQLGYGVFRVENRAELLDKAKGWRWMGIAGQQQPHPTLPDLRRFGFFQFRFQPAKPGWWTNISGLERVLGRRDTAQALRELVALKMVPVVPALKNAWRFAHWQGPPWIDQHLFGTSRGNDRQRSKIAASWAYQEEAEWCVRGWTWFPEKDDRERDIPPQSIQALWKILVNEQIWQATLKTKAGVLRYEPETITFEARNASEIRQQLLEVKT